MREEKGIGAEDGEAVLGGAGCHSRAYFQFVSSFRIPLNVVHT